MRTAILRERYLLPGEVSAEQMFKRVADWIAADQLSPMRRVYYNLMADNKFLPNSPTLMNAGTSLGQLSACFVLPVEDSIESIFEAAKQAAIIQKTGGGTGFNFSHLRAAGERVKSTNGKASGVLSFMKVFDVVTDTIKQGGKRRGANMGILNQDHPEINSFIRAKYDGLFHNFNLSVGITGKMPTRLLESISMASHACGDPGLLFLDRINALNPAPFNGPIEATNPCGELPLRPYESCNLGSMNLVEYYTKSGGIDHTALRNDIETAILFLDGVIDANNYPFQEIEVATLETRKIGLGVMGFADLLIKMGIRYDEKEAVDMASLLARTLERDSLSARYELGGENKALNTIAPTGTISKIAGVSSSIEPNYAKECTYRVLDQAFTVQHPLADDDDFVAACDVPPEQHVRIQAAFQEHIDNAVSKTVNMPADATVDDVMEVFLLARKLGCKGVTVYRDGSQKAQPQQKCEDGKCAL